MMLVLGISGGPELLDEGGMELSHEALHDSAAVLVEDGKIVAGIEEERLNRLKHTHKAASSAAKFCLDTRGVKAGDVDLFAFYGSEKYIDSEIRRSIFEHGSRRPLMKVRELHRAMLRRALGAEIEDSKIIYVPHHRAHGLSAYAASGFDESLVVSLDWQGDDIAGEISVARGNKLELLHTIEPARSLGRFYQRITFFLGYSSFDEYKVMGLAPYGDPTRFRPLFSEMYRLSDDGNYELDLDRLDRLFAEIPPRVRGSAFAQVYKDIAAAGQEALENIVLHLLSGYQKKTKMRRLSLAGGVAHNCSLNGKVVYRGLFDEVFVQPASSDAGCSLGAALSPFFDRGVKLPKIRDVFWGTAIGEGDAIGAELERWKTFVGFERLDQVTKKAAELLADGAAIGWCQGRSEFGPRALGNRSILADPRPAENRRIINEMVKKRESYRPFAPAVLEERAGEFFNIPANRADFSFMSFVLSVREEKRASLGAVTHVDGTARVQTVSRETNPRFWELIHAFGELTGVPVLLNTSFNNDVEPIVDSVQDAITSYLTTKLNHLVVGDWLVTRRRVGDEEYLNLVVSLPPHMELRKVTRQGRPATYGLGHVDDGGFGMILSEPMYRLLSKVDGQKCGAELCQPDDDRRILARNLRELWDRRVIVLHP